MGIKFLAEGLISNKFLRYLFLNNNGIDDEGAECLFNTLKENNTLKKLYLEENEICEGKGIGDFLEYNSTLEYLNLNRNFIGDSALKLEFEFGENSSLKELHLEEN